MVKPAPTLAALLAVPVLALSACSSPQHATSEPGTTPPVWTGQTSPQSAPTPEPDSGAETLSAELKSPDGTPVAEAKIEFSGGFATITVQTIGDGVLKPGFHGIHLHSVGKCEANSVAPTGGAPGNFLSAGGHFQAPGHSDYPASGDLSNIFIRKDGAGMLVTTSDAFTAEELLGGQHTAIMIHEKPTNFANIPPERYQQTNGSPPPDQESLATGDAGARVACGVIEG